MSIRKRLATFMILMTGLLLVMGGLVFVGGRVMLTAFRQSLEAMNSLNSIRELRTHVQRQRVSLNQYLLVGDSQELLNFEEALQQAQKTLDGVKAQNHALPPWFDDVEEHFTKTTVAAGQITQLYKQGNKTKAFDETSSKLYPEFQKLLDRVNALEREKTDEAGSRFVTVRHMSDRAGVIVFGVIGLALFFGFLFFLSLYRAVMRPLEILRNGADQFGKGQWDHKIDLPTSNEFGSLADSFNNMAQNVRQLQEQAIHMDRMSAVGQLAGGVAHEINNPLTGVLGQAQILLAKTPETSPVHAQLKKIEQAALRCKKIVRGLLDFSRPSQIHFEEIDANEILVQTMDLCEADLKGTKVAVERRFSKLLPKVEGNGAELQQVLLNLINNALQAMSHGGTLTLETISHSQALTIVDRRKGAPPKTSNGPWVEIIVRDTGHGIAKEHLTRIFEPFFTTKEIGKGTGLGLSVSMGIVKKHGGDLRVESPGINKGASFHLVLPAKSGTGVKRPSGMGA